jgi:signal transduction histidine kinase/CheY-like chemotaxis protein/HAMP domain-containing protein
MIKYMTLRKKVTFILVVIVSFINLIFGSYLILYFKDVRLSNFYEHKNNLANITLSNVLPGMEFGQKDFLEDFFARLERDREFTFSAIYDRSNKLYMNHINPYFPLNFSELEGKHFEDSRFFVIQRKIISEVQGDLGTLVLGFNQGQIIKEINTILIQLVVFLLLLTLVIIITLYIVMEKVAIGPIKSLMHITENLAGGDLSARVPIRKRDELGNLSANFNLMAESLSENFDALERNKNEILQLQLFLNNIIENSPNGVITIDHQARIIKINKSAVHMLNWQMLDYDRKVIYEMDSNFFDYKDSISEVSHKNIPLRFDRQVLTVANKEKVFNMLMYSIPYEDATGVVILLVDMTEQVSLEKQLIQSQKMEAVGTLAGGIAHDFNNILTIIMGYISVLKLQIENRDMVNKINLIDEAVQRATELVKQILLISRKDSGKFESIDLSDVMDSLLAMGRELFPRSIKIDIDYEKESFPIYGDKNQLSQVLMNILINAKDAIEVSSGKNSGYIQISLRKIFVDSFVRKFYKDVESANYVEIKISDNGCGMEKSIIENIFDPFFTTKPKGKGTGLGLAIVYGIIKNHGGEISVYSEKDKGSIFIILLPLKEKKVVKKEIQKQKLFYGKGNIMLVDDEADILDTTDEMLGLLGYKSKSFNNGQSALEHFKRHHNKIDLIILDIMMPDLDGIKMYLKLKDIANPPPVVFCSGYFEDNLIDELKMEYKNVYFLQKPFNLHELSKCVYRLVGRQEKTTGDDGE